MKEKFVIWLAWLLPRSLAYWAAIRVISAGTVGKYSGQVVPDLTGLEALRRWNR